MISPLEAFRSCSLGWIASEKLIPLLDRVRISTGHEPSHPLEVPFYRKDASEINRAALGWISGQEGRPFFAFLNYFDAHDPYLVPDGAGHPFAKHPATLAERQVLRHWIEEVPRARTPDETRLAHDSYDDCLAYLDGQLGRLIADLGRLGRLDNTVIVITSDHGEHFGEHARDGLPLMGHRQSVYQPEIHVPLLVIAPGRLPSATVVSDVVSLRDLPQTIVDLAGIPDRSPFPGRSFLPAEGGGRIPGSAFAEYLPEEQGLPFSARYQPGAVGRMKAVVAEDRSYHRRGDGHEELYDLANDPAETIDLAKSKDSSAPLHQLRSTLNGLDGPGEAKGSPGHEQQGR